MISKAALDVALGEASDAVLNCQRALALLHRLGARLGCTEMRDAYIASSS